MSKKLIKKIATMVFIAVMSIAIFVACTEEIEEIDTATPTTTLPTSEAAPEAESVQENGETARILPNLPARHVLNMEGRTLRVLTGDWGDWGGVQAEIFNSRDIVAEEETGSPINDAVYRRNRAVEERYNFTIQQIFPTNDPVSFAPLFTLRRAVAGGDDYFDVCSFSTVFMGAAAQGGLLVDLFSLLYVDLEKPWWDQNAIAGMSIGNRLFFTSGDFVLVNRDACPAVLFNKQLISDFQLDCYVPK